MNYMKRQGKQQDYTANNTTESGKPVSPSWQQLEAHREKGKLAMRQYRLRNRDKILAKRTSRTEEETAAWREKKRVYQRKYRAEHAEEIKEKELQS
ncbi:hypothetical protein VTN00DRAFT_2300 [Thermoascus crustaceus]|uniref:uncharacterized protein n=1 Tax=Thermoascus crustaceus TaxID=5088 RepID=UPI003742B29F